ncbi:MAG: M48 family metallopeptidase [Dehalococcoidales bacterium]|nr:MAG: M48 family metallopeptidase [Dehalococcoidales bacterium]
MWEQVRSNRIRSVVLVGMMAALLLGVGYLLGEAFLDSPVSGLVIALVILAVLNLVAFFQGDNIMLALSRARKIKRDDHPRLYNIVEEMKIASGLERMPDVYIIDDQAMNAFATGRDANHASVAVTAGLLQALNRDELQGVVGHELAHIKNRDVLLMSLCGVLLGAIVILAWYGSRIMLFGGMAGGRRSSRGGGGGGGGIIIIVAIVLAILAPILAQLIYFAISRKREYMADASSALYTRYPEGLASALEKLGGSKIQVQGANQATAPAYIINPFREKGRAAADLTSTHPPISERIRILRSMGGGASLADYNKSYQSIHKGGKPVFSGATLAGAGIVDVRAAVPEAAPTEHEPSKAERTREVSNLMWRMNKYETVDCDCGTKLKIPPDFKRSNIRCPHCGRINNVRPNR